MSSTVSTSTAVDNTTICCCVSPALMEWRGETIGAPAKLPHVNRSYLYTARKAKSLFWYSLDQNKALSSCEASWLINPLLFNTFFSVAWSLNVCRCTFSPHRRTSQDILSASLFSGCFEEELRVWKTSKHDPVSRYHIHLVPNTRRRYVFVSEHPAVTL